ncbi:nucleotidyltransferase family protein [Bacillus sp. NPDC077027]|uniref:nucleotidyltransferase family protein n=1 Tax=Bacillus sp. NPDC077027 TaxID=3390548 RepID=UPI003D025949
MLPNELTREEQTVLVLSKPFLRENEIKDMKQLLFEQQDWNLILGMLHVHRTAGIAWKNIKEHAIHLRKEFKATYFLKSLEIMYKGQLETAMDNIKFNDVLFKALDQHGIVYGIVKGSVVGEWAYGDVGLRLFGDNDLFISQEQLHNTEAVLKNLGYIQGSWNYETQTVTPAKRSEILYLIMNSHQTYTYMKPSLECRFMDCHRIDVQFSVDLMSGNRTHEIVRDMLERRIQTTIANHYPVWTLKEEDMLLFLCIHFYKEAIYLSEVKAMKDLLLYKLLDIYGLFLKENMLDVTLFVKRTKDYGFEKMVYFAFHYVNEVFPNTISADVMDELRPVSLTYLSEVFDTSEVVHTWDQPIVKRFFHINRSLDIQQSPVNKE